MIVSSPDMRTKVNVANFLASVGTGLALGLCVRLAMANRPFLAVLAGTLVVAITYTNGLLTGRAMERYGL